MVDQIYLMRPRKCLAFKDSLSFEIYIRSPGLVHHSAVHRGRLSARRCTAEPVKICKISLMSVWFLLAIERSSAIYREELIGFASLFSGPEMGTHGRMDISFDNQYCTHLMHLVANQILPCAHGSPPEN